MRRPSQFLPYNPPVPVSYLVFDLDDTLYPPGNGLWTEIGERINRFLVERAGVEPAQVNDVRRHYLQTYGTTLRGLLANHPGVDADDYLSFVHPADLSPYIAPNPALDSMLAALPQPKAIFTNGDTAHTFRVLACLGVDHRFSAIVDIRAMNFENKPLPKAYETLLNRIGVHASECLIVEDSVRNLRPAKALGMTTLLIGNGHDPDPAVDYRANTILDAGPIIRTLTTNHCPPIADH